MFSRTLKKIIWQLLIDKISNLLNDIDFRKQDSFIKPNTRAFIARL